VGVGESSLFPPTRHMTRRYTDAENTGVPVVPMLSGRTDAEDSRADFDEQVYSHRVERV
jgi:hypothetical protein